MAPSIDPLPIIHPMRTASLSKPVLQHPTPDLQTLQGAYVQNVERLEEHAERMSLTSDLAEEIQKMDFEQKLSASRRSSIYSGHPDDLNRINSGSASASRRMSYQQISRNVSNSSHAQSIVDVNKEARFGGYSPGGYVNVGSPNSNSWSHVSAPRSRSATRGGLRMQTGHIFADSSIVNSPTDEPLPESSFEHDDSRYFPTPMMGGFHGPFTDGAVQPRSIPHRMPSDGSYTKLYDQIIEANGSQASAPSARLPSHASFTDLYDELAGDITEELGRVGGQDTRASRRSSRSGLSGDALEEAPPPVPEKNTARQAPHVEREHRSGSTGGRLQVRNDDSVQPSISPDVALLGEPISFDGTVLESAQRGSTSTASEDTFLQAQELFGDFDGSHAAPSIRNGLLGMSAISEGRPAPEARQSRIGLGQFAVPPPADGMVYYPAPVPRQLNLPKRLSQMPSAVIQADRRSQLLSQLPADARKSAIWLGPDSQVDSPPKMNRRRSSMMNVAGNLPPQLRASMYFENPGASADVEIQHGSAVATLEDLLDAAAVAPVSAFTNHPIAGEDGARIYRKTRRTDGSPSKVKGKSSVDLRDTKTMGARTASFLGFGGRPSGVDNTDEGSGPSTDKSPARKAKRMSSAPRLSFPAMSRKPSGTVLHSYGIDEEADSHDEDTGLDRLNGENYIYEGVEAGESQDEDGEFDEIGEESEEEDPEYDGPPTTLLAELQYRKAHQKTRNLTAANASAFPGGMHSTLLELDAVAQLEKAKRKKTRVALAWEDPEIHRALEEPEDDDVPLGILYGKPTQTGLPAHNRPIGLLEKKEIEENEPLSSRRNRMLGISAPPRSPVKSVTTIQPPRDPNEEDKEDPMEVGETLAQRVRRLRDKKQLDAALESVTDDRSFADDFSPEMVLKSPTQNRQSREVTTPGPELADETLGQRRARLQRENDQDGLEGVGHPRPTLNNRRSTTDLLTVYPTVDHPDRPVLQSSYTERGLLQISQAKLASNKKALQSVNLRSASYGADGGLDRPLVDVQRPDIGGRRKSGAFANGIYNNGTGGEGQNAMHGLNSDARDTQGNALGMGAGNGFVAKHAASRSHQIQPGQMPYGAFNPAMGMNMNMNTNMPYGAAGGGAQQTPYGMNPMLAVQASMLSLHDPSMMMQHQAYNYPSQLPYQQIYGMPMQSMQNLSPQQHLPRMDSTFNNKRGSRSSVNLLNNMGGGLGNAGVGGRGAQMFPGQMQSMAMPGMGMPMMMQMGVVDPRERDRIDAWRQEVTGQPLG